MPRLRVETIDLLYQHRVDPNVPIEDVAAIAWLLARRPWIAPIPGTTKLHRLEENIRSTEGELTADDLAEIERAAFSITIEGHRYPAAVESLTNI